DWSSDVCSSDLPSSIARPKGSPCGCSRGAVDFLGTASSIIERVEVRSSDDHDIDVVRDGATDPLVTSCPRAEHKSLLDTFDGAEFALKHRYRTVGDHQ